MFILSLRRRRYTVGSYRHSTPTDDESISPKRVSPDSARAILDRVSQRARSNKTAGTLRPNVDGDDARAKI